MLLDAPLTKQGQPTWLLRELGPDFTLLVFGPAPAWAHGLPGVKVLQVGIDVIDHQALAAQRLDALPRTVPGAARPACGARWRTPNGVAVRSALARCHGAAVLTRKTTRNMPMLNATEPAGLRRLL